MIIIYNTDYSHSMINFLSIHDTTSCHSVGYDAFDDNFLKHTSHTSIGIKYFLSLESKCTK